MSELKPQVIRVLTGPLTGTEKPLPPSGRVSIGHEFWHDVVLRDASTGGIAADLEIAPDGTVRLTALEGDVVMLGSHVAPGETVLLPAFVPLTLGAISLAWGAAESLRWSEASALAGSVSVPAVQPAPEPLTPIDRAYALVDRIWLGVGEMLSSRMAASAALLAGAVVIVAAALPAIDSLEIGPNDRSRALRALQKAGYTSLGVDQGPEGLMITGLVHGEKDRMRVQSALDTAYVPAIVDVQTDQELARAAINVARINGVTATARAPGTGVVELRTPGLDPELRERLDRAVRADVPGIARLVIRDDLPGGDGPVRSVSDIAKRVASVVAGDPSFVLTDDGARYFAGAVMPTGHTLIGIEGSQVLLEKNGHRTQISF